MQSPTQDALRCSCSGRVRDCMKMQSTDPQHGSVGLSRLAVVFHRVFACKAGASPLWHFFLGQGGSSQGRWHHLLTHMKYGQRSPKRITQKLRSGNQAVESLKTLGYSYSRVFLSALQMGKASLPFSLMGSICSKLRLFQIQTYHLTLPQDGCTERVYWKP